MKKLSLFFTSLMLVGFGGILHAEGNISAGKEKSSACAGCHGEDGNSEVATFPKLAGQHAVYLEKQLKAFKSGARNNAMMAPMATGLSDDDITDIASYYASKSLTPNKLPEAEKSADGSKASDMDKLLAEGRDLYRNGDLASQVSACISCHGPFGDGNKPAAFPVLKAQHAEYLIQTLTDFKTNARSNNPENMMHMIARKLSDEEIKAVFVLSFYIEIIVLIRNMPMLFKLFLKTFGTMVLFSYLTLANAEDLGYETITPPQPTQNPDKVEVIEFFWYGCPHCYHLEPEIVKWLKTKPKNVEFIRQPAVFSKVWGDHAKAYFTAEALGIVEKVHADFFDAIQNQHQTLESEDDLAKFFKAHGVEEKAFHDAYNSFLVDTKFRQASTMGARYGITGVPALIINGKYKTTGALAKSQPNMITVMNQLIQKESQGH